MSLKKIEKLACVLLGFFFVVIQTCFSTVYYVDASGGNNANNGLTWAGAKKDLYATVLAAATTASDQSPNQVWMKAGVYKPDQYYFTLANNVAIYGGFSGNESALEQRDIIANLTICSSDMNDDDQWADNWDDNGSLQGLILEDGKIVLPHAGWLATDANRSDNLRRVFYKSESLSSTAILDGITVLGGGNAAYDADVGGGVRVSGTPTIRNCIFVANSAESGGGLYMSSGGIVENCKFIANRTKDSSTKGGGLLSYGAISISNCLFEGNHAWGRLGAYSSSRQSYGGGCYVYSGTTFNNCVFNNNAAVTYNTSKSRGGGVYGSGGADMIDCSFTNNSADHGGAFCGAGTIADSTFSHNKAIRSGAAVFAMANGLAITSTLFEENDGEAFFAGDFYDLNIRSGTHSLTDCEIKNHEISSGAKVVNCGLGINTSLNRCVVKSNSVSDRDSSSSYIAVIYNTGTLTFRQVSFSENTFTGNGKMIYNRGVLACYSSTFSDNTVQSLETDENAVAYGGVIYGTSDADRTALVNSTFANNRAIASSDLGMATAIGGAVTTFDNSFIFNCTFYNNAAIATSAFGSSSSKGGGFFGNGNARIANCIFWQNEADSSAQLGSSGASLYGGYCVVQDGQAPTQFEHVITDDPGLAVDLDQNGGLTLSLAISQSGSAFDSGVRLFQDTDPNITLFYEDPAAPGSYLKLLTHLSYTPADADIEGRCVNLTDQRGILRPQSVRVDIGAFEKDLSDPDADGDGMDDAWEIEHFGSTTNCHPSYDGDLDGQSNLDEFISGMNPTNRSSFFKATINEPAVEAAHVVVEWSSTLGRYYTVSWTTNLVDGFQVLETKIEHPQNSFTNLAPNVALKGFYRIDVRLK